MVAEQGLYILQHTNVYYHVSHIQASALGPGDNDRQRQDQVEELKDKEYLMALPKVEMVL